MPISPLPAAPSRAQSPASFATSADAFLGQLSTFAAEATALEQAVNAAEIVVVAAESVTLAAKNAAQSAQAAAEAVASAAAWTAGTAYTTGQCVFGTDGQTYRALDASTGVNPVGDTTGKWVRISAGGSPVIKSSNFVAVIGHRYILDPGIECTLPQSPSIGDAIGLRSVVTTNWPRLMHNGLPIYGDTEDRNLNGLGEIILTWAGVNRGGWI